MVLIRERIYTINSSNRRFIITWVGFLAFFFNLNNFSYFKIYILSIFTNKDSDFLNSNFLFKSFFAKKVCIVS